MRANTEMTVQSAYDSVIRSGISYTTALGALGRCLFWVVILRRSPPIMSPIPAQAYE